MTCGCLCVYVCVCLLYHTITIVPTVTPEEEKMLQQLPLPWKYTVPAFPLFHSETEKHLKQLECFTLTINNNLTSLLPYLASSVIDEHLNTLLLSSLFSQS